MVYKYDVKTDPFLARYKIKNAPIAWFSDKKVEVKKWYHCHTGVNSKYSYVSNV